MSIPIERIRGAQGGPLSFLIFDIVFLIFQCSSGLTALLISIIIYSTLTRVLGLTFAVDNIRLAIL